MDHRQLLVSVPPVWPPRHLPLVTPITGLLAGLFWGVAARMWMRWITTSPEFTWAGTLYILAAPTVLGAVMGAVAAARRRRADGRWGLSLLAVLPLGMGAGVIMLPTAVLGAFAWWRRGMAGWLRALLALLAVAPTLVVAREVWDDLAWRPHGGEFVAATGIGWYLLLCLGLVLGLAPAASPTARIATAPGRDQVQSD